MESKRKKPGKKVTAKSTNRKRKLSSYSTSPRDTKKREDIKMYKKGDKNSSANTDIKLVMGKKEQKQRKRIITLAVVCILLFSVVLFSALTPTGPFEYLQNKFLSLGNGSYPVSLSGSELKNAYSVDTLIYALTDTHAEVFNNSGKQLFSRQHEFNSPALSVSSQRALVYDIGGRNVYVFNHSDVISEITSEYDIYCASIGRNGTVAIASKSKGYASQVQVLSKNGKEKFVWYSSNEIINNVAVSNNGRRIAVSTVDSAGGKFKSKVYVFKFSSANPIYEFTYEDSVVYSLNTVSGSYFSAVTNKSVDFIKWRNGEKQSNESSLTIKLFRKFDNKKSIAVLGNKSNNSIVLYNSNGKKITEFEFSGVISDVSLGKEIIYVMSDGYLYAVDFEGKILLDKINVSSYNRIFSQGSDSVVAAGNFGLNKFSVK